MATRIVDRIAYEVRPPVGGAGDALLMIHGLGGTSNTWSPVLAALKQFGVILPDLPGSGRSSSVQGALSISSLVDAVLRVLQASGVTRAHVAGHSMGAIVALHLAVRDPKRIKSLALFGPLAAPPDSAREPLRARAQKARSEGASGMQAIADQLLGATVASRTREQKPLALAFVRESIMRQCPDGYARSCEALAQAQAADLSALKVPSLLVTGDEDPIAPPQAVRMLAEKLAAGGTRIQTEILRGCGHWPTVEMPEACIDLARRFYAQRFTQ